MEIQLKTSEGGQKWTKYCDRKMTIRRRLRGRVENVTVISVHSYFLEDDKPRSNERPISGLRNRDV